MNFKCEYLLLFLKGITFAGNLLMVVGGQSDEKTEDKGYVISLDDTIPVPSCLQSICDFPHYFLAATSGIFGDGLPTVCGGRKVSPYTYYDSCYKFNYTNAWVPAGSMSSSLSYAGEFQYFINRVLIFSSISFTFIAHSYQEGWGLIQTGGYNHLEIENSPGHEVDTVDFSSDGETWEMLPTQIPDGTDFTM